MADDSYYQRHAFFCTNVRDEGAARPSCGRCGSDALRAYLKEKVKTADLNGPGAIRVNKSGCLDRCEEGPVLVIYPEATWYTYVDEEDLDEIFEEHLVHGRVVERLKLD
ncbi:MAG: (2Fe-2S) ferredoxin domain-containing protein [Gammaproteobacteria bacterium]|nr:(2Fe-2S) ferredoxin domain-containing protein [Gammaproteobacteria bacterium]